MRNENLQQKFLVLACAIASLCAPGMSLAANYNDLKQCDKEVFCQYGEESCEESAKNREVNEERCSQFGEPDCFKQSPGFKKNQPQFGEGYARPAQTDDSQDCTEENSFSPQFN